MLVIHLLKWEFQPQQRSGSWEGSLIEHRRRVNKALKESPLNSYLVGFEAEGYQEAVEQATAETGLPLEVFPLDFPYELTDILKAGFLPS